MERWAVFATIGTAILPTIGALIFLWSDVQTMKQTKIDYREVAELRTEVTKQLTKNTEAIENLNKLIRMFIEERRKNEQKESSN